MSTEEEINGIKVSIEWEFIEIVDRHDSNWCEWIVNGIGSNGLKYSATCEADGSNPSDLYSDVKEIEVIGEMVLPAWVSFKNDFNEMFP